MAEVRKWGSLMKYYTVYLRKTDEIIAFGTADECAAQLGLSGKNSFHCTASKSRNGKANKYEIIVEDSPYDDMEVAD